MQLTIGISALLCFCFIVNGQASVHIYDEEIDKEARSLVCKGMTRKEGYPFKKDEAAWIRSTHHAYLNVLSPQPLLSQCMALCFLLRAKSKQDCVGVTVRKFGMHACEFYTSKEAKYPLTIKPYPAHPATSIFTISCNASSNSSEDQSSEHNNPVDQTAQPEEPGDGEAGRTGQSEGQPGDGEAGQTGQTPACTAPDGVCNCGRTDVVRSNFPKASRFKRVIGGLENQRNGWPWLLALTCGASLIRLADEVEESDIAITAFHCLVDVRTGKPTWQSKKAIAGAHSIKRLTGQEQSATIQKPIFYPNISVANVFDGDIAVLKFDSHAAADVLRPIKFTEEVQPICLPASYEKPEWFMTSGWGETGNGASDVPKETLKVPVKTQNCEVGWHKAYKDGPVSPGSVPSMICVEDPENDSTICRGDSGGPLMQQSNGRWELAGVTCHVKKIIDFGKCPIHLPSAYTKVATFGPWIRETICKESSLADRITRCK